MRIAFDLDGVLVDFGEGFNKRAVALGYESLDWSKWNGGNWDVFNAVWEQIKRDERFWVGLPVTLEGAALRDVIRPSYYITHRSIPSEVSFEWIIKNGFFPAPVISVGKDDRLKVGACTELEIDIMIEDKFENWEAINSNTSTICFLINKPYNQDAPKTPFEHLRTPSLDTALACIEVIKDVKSRYDILYR
jgi:hypothetical protein